MGVDCRYFSGNYDGYNANYDTASTCRTATMRSAATTGMSG